MNMKYVSAIFAAVIISIIISGCLNNKGNKENGAELVIIENGDDVPAKLCTKNQQNNKVIVFHSENCPACRLTVPILEDIQSETTVEFEFIDTENDRERIDELGFATGHIPGVIIKCRAYVGYKQKQDFLDLIF